MSGKKVYDLAKEYDVQSKDFVLMLQQASIPVKNHMSALTEQQEKYFRNNYDIVNGALVQKSAKEVKEAIKQSTDKPKPASPQTAAPPAAANKPAAGTQPQRRPNPDRNPSGAGAPRREQYRQNEGAQQRPNNRYQGQQNQQGGYRKPYQGGQQDSSQGQQGGYRKPYQGSDRQGSNQNQQSGYRRPYNSSSGQGAGQNQQGGYRKPYNPADRQGGNSQGQQGGGYSQQNRPGGYNRNQNPNAPYNRQGSQNQGTGARPYNSQQRPYGTGQQKPYGQQGQGQGGFKKPATDEKPLEKQGKNDKARKESKQKTEQKNKAKENFFADNRPLGRLDNTKHARGSKSSYKKKKLESWEERATSGVTGVVTIPEAITVSELSEKILISAVDIIKILMSYGIMANVNQTLDFDTASIICEELDIEVKLEEEEDVIEAILQKHFEDKDKLKKRPPIITVMGHVDHGKTSLLDYIKNSNVIKGEAGGITQHIGAYTIDVRDNKITFIDTPGHEAFTAMRSRGASVTDIAVLVVAADDGVKPQTIEAINHAKAAEVPIVVAINKIDKPAANPEKVKQELTEYGLVAEDWGGTTICADISAKTGEGVNDLLDMILLVAEVEDLKANFEMNAVGTVIEARIDKQRGITATLIVKSGTLHDGDIIVTGTLYGKIRVMTDYLARKIDEAGPSMAVEILGLDEVPSAGDKFFVVENEREAKKICDRRKDRMSLLALKSAAPITKDDIFNQISQGEMKQINLIIKADVQGSFEAIKQSLEKLNDNDEGIKITVLHGGVGVVTDTDVSLAKASGALIIAFNVKTGPNTKLLSEKEEVEIKTYSVIYDIINDIEDAMKGLKEPEYEEVVTGTAQVRAVYKIPDLGFIAGSYITNGAVTRKDSVRVIRDGGVIFTGEVSSLKRMKDDVKEVASGYECGIGISKYNDIKEEDVLEFFTMRLVEN